MKIYKILFVIMVVLIVGSFREYKRWAKKQQAFEKVLLPVKSKLPDLSQEKFPPEKVWCEKKSLGDVFYVAYAKNRSTLLCSAGKGDKGLREWSEYYAAYEAWEANRPGDSLDRAKRRWLRKSYKRRIVQLPENKYTVSFTLPVFSNGKFAGALAFTVRKPEYFFNWEPKPLSLLGLLYLISPIIVFPFWFYFWTRDK
ncbi:MAG: hypothetical protein D6780_04825 [Candidatus Dadabacteria bacterium]|nr:MAG: hypothetical protein D6780_04825 [Candidatus Dadabacteria bacterium]